MRRAHCGIPQSEHQLTEKFRGVKPFQFSFRCCIPDFHGRSEIIDFLDRLPQAGEP